MHVDVAKRQVAHNRQVRSVHQIPSRDATSCSFGEGLPIDRLHGGVGQPESPDQPRVVQVPPLTVVPGSGTTKTKLCGEGDMSAAV